MQSSTVGDRVDGRSPLVMSHPPRPQPTKRGAHAGSMIQRWSARQKLRCEPGRGPRLPPGGQGSAGGARPNSVLLGQTLTEEIRFASRSQITHGLVGSGRSLSGRDRYRSISSDRQLCDDALSP